MEMSPLHVCLNGICSYCHNMLFEAVNVCIVCACICKVGGLYWLVTVSIFFNSTNTVCLVMEN